MARFFSSDVPGCRHVQATVSSEAARTHIVGEGMTSAVALPIVIPRTAPNRFRPGVAPLPPHVAPHAGNYPHPRHRRINRACRFSAVHTTAFRHARVLLLLTETLEASRKSRNGDVPPFPGRLFLVVVILRNVVSVAVLQSMLTIACGSSRRCTFYNRHR